MIKYELVTFEVKGNLGTAKRFLDALKLCYIGPSLGGVETLVSEPRFTSHAALSPEERAAQGIPDGFLRVSVVIEDIDDIIADFEDAFSTL